MNVTALWCVFERTWPRHRDRLIVTPIVSLGPSAPSHRLQSIYGSLQRVLRMSTFLDLVFACCVVADGGMGRRVSHVLLPSVCCGLCVLEIRRQWILAVGSRLHFLDSYSRGLLLTGVCLARWSRFVRGLFWGVSTRTG